MRTRSPDVAEADGGTGRASASINELMSNGASVGAAIALLRPAEVARARDERPGLEAEPDVRLPSAELEAGGGGGGRRDGAASAAKPPVAATMSLQAAPPSCETSGVKPRPAMRITSVVLKPSSDGSCASVASTALSQAAHMG